MLAAAPTAIDEEEGRRTMSAEARSLASDPRHVAFARKVARDYAARSGIDPNEAESSAMLGLCQAAMRFDPSNGSRFSTFAARRIKGAIVDECRLGRIGGRYNPLNLSVESIDAPCPSDGTMLRDLISSDDGPIGEAEESADVVESILKHLPHQDRQVLRLAYLDASGGTLDAAARSMGLSRSRVSQIHSRALDLIRDRGLAIRALTPRESRPMPASAPPPTIARRPRHDLLDAGHKLTWPESPAAPDDVPTDHPTPTPEEPPMSLAMTVDRPEPEPPAGPEPNPKSRFRGVCWSKAAGRWQAIVCTPNGNKYAGTYHDETEAARAYDRKARELLGDKARPNFPDEAPAVAAAVQPAPPVVTPRPKPAPEPAPSPRVVRFDDREPEAETVHFCAPSPIVGPVEAEAAAPRKPENDPVNNPVHYRSHPSGVECIAITEHMGFNLGNAVKYIWRADLKASAIEDLRKAEWYVRREIARREKEALS